MRSAGFFLEEHGATETMETWLPLAEGVDDVVGLVVDDAEFADDVIFAAAAAPEAEGGGEAGFDGDVAGVEGVDVEVPRGRVRVWTRPFVSPGLCRWPGPGISCGWGPAFSASASCAKDRAAIIPSTAQITSGRRVERFLLPRILNGWDLPRKLGEWPAPAHDNARNEQKDTARLRRGRVCREGAERHGLAVVALEDLVRRSSRSRRR